MQEFIVRVIDYFLPDHLLGENDLEKKWLGRSFNGIILFIILLLVFTEFLQILGLFESKFYILTSISISFIILFFFKKTKSLFISVNLFCLAFFALAAVDIINNGLIYSEPLFFLIFIPIAAFVFYNIKVGIFWIALIMLFLVFIFMESTNATNFLPASSRYDDPKYSLYLHVIFFFEILGLLYVVSKSKSIVIEKLDSKQKILDTKTSQLEDQTTELLKKTGELEQLKTELIFRNDNLSKYAAITAHDLKQPIRTMTSFASLLKNELQANDSEKVNEYLDFIITGGKQMQIQVEKVLDIANLSDSIEFDLLDTYDILKNTIGMLDNQIKKSKAEIKILQIPDKIVANEVSIKKVFQNLLSNGIKFNDKEKVCIEISGKETPSEWQFTIKDNGNGIEKLKQDDIFEYGIRNSSSSEGSGIGLNICRKLIQLHMGKIWINSTLGNGSEFIFSIKKNLQL